MHERVFVGRIHAASGAVLSMAVTDGAKLYSMDRRACVLLVAASAIVLVSSCRPPTNSSQLQPIYDAKSGKLMLMKVSSKGDGRIDTWSYMDGTRFIRIEMDKNQDGLVDRWEHYGTDQKLEKIGFSRANDGKPDAWAYQGQDGNVARVEISTQNDGRISRVEHYEAGALARAEEDTDADGKMDKWETYADGAVTSVAFDTKHRGVPDRRLRYGPGGSATVEEDPAGTGKFVAQGRRD